MNLRSRIERLEEILPDESLADWVDAVMIGGHIAGRYALNAVTGEESQDPELLNRLERRSKQRAKLGMFEEFEVIIGEPIGHQAEERHNAEP